jgi:hypothetical protein
LALALFGACGRETRIKVSIAGTEAIGIDSFQLRIEDRFAVAYSLDDVELPQGADAHEDCQQGTPSEESTKMQEQGFTSQLTKFDARFV